MTKNQISHYIMKRLLIGLIFLPLFSFSQNFESLFGTYKVEFDYIKMIETAIEDNKYVKRNTENMEKHIITSNSCNIGFPIASISKDNIIIQMNEKANSTMVFTFKSKNVKKRKGKFIIKDNDGKTIILTPKDGKVLLDTQKLNLILAKN